MFAGLCYASRLAHEGEAAFDAVLTEVTEEPSELLRRQPIRASNLDGTFHQRTRLRNRKRKTA